MYVRWRGKEGGVLEILEGEGSSVGVDVSIEEASKRAANLLPDPGEACFWLMWLKKTSVVWINRVVKWRPTKVIRNLEH